MPIYEYQCTDCGEVEEVFQKISEPALTTCRHCNGQLKKLISQSSFQLKGSGWYVTDYGGSKAKNAGKKACKCKDSSEKKTEASCASSKKEK